MKRIIILFLLVLSILVLLQDVDTLDRKLFSSHTEDRWEFLLFNPSILTSILWAVVYFLELFIFGSWLKKLNKKYLSIISYSFIFLLLAFLSFKFINAHHYHWKFKTIEEFVVIDVEYRQNESSEYVGSCNRIFKSNIELLLARIYNDEDLELIDSLLMIKHKGLDEFHKGLRSFEVSRSSYFTSLNPKYGLTGVLRGRNQENILQIKNINQFYFDNYSLHLPKFWLKEHNIRKKGYDYSTFIQCGMHLMRAELKPQKSNRPPNYDFSFLNYLDCTNNKKWIRINEKEIRNVELLRFLLLKVPPNIMFCVDTLCNEKEIIGDLSISESCKTKKSGYELIEYENRSESKVRDTENYYWYLKLNLVLRDKNVTHNWSNINLNFKRVVEQIKSSRAGKYKNYGNYDFNDIPTLTFK